MAKTAGRGKTHGRKRKGGIGRLAGALRPQCMNMLRGLQSVGAPVILMKLMYLILTAPCIAKQLRKHIDALELFAGERAISEATLRAGRKACSYDIVIDPVGNNIMGTVGWLCACVLTLKLKPGSQVNTAPVCSSWTWMNRATSGRSAVFPLGNKHVKSVAVANAMVSRQVLLLYSWTAAGHFWMLEQPCGSLLEYHPRLQQFLKEHKVYRTRVNLGDFGAASQKPVWLYSNFKFITKLNGYCMAFGSWKHNGAEPLVSIKIKSNGQRAVIGKPGVLKASQAYPKGFGEAVAQLYDDHVSEIMAYARARAQEALHQQVNLSEVLNFDESSAPRHQDSHVRGALCMRF